MVILPEKQKTQLAPENIINKVHIVSSFLKNKKKSFL